MIVYKILGVTAVLMIAAWGGYEKGSKDKNDEWQLRWNEQERTILADNAAHYQRQAELQAEINNINQVNDYAQQKINELTDANRALSATTNSLRTESQAAAKRIAACSKNAATTNSSQTTKTGADLLAGLFDESTERNQRLAGEAEAYRIAGEACEKAYKEAQRVINGE